MSYKPFLPPIADPHSEVMHIVYDSIDGKTRWMRMYTVEWVWQPAGYDGPGWMLANTFRGWLDQRRTEDMEEYHKYLMELEKLQT